MRFTEPQSSTVLNTQLVPLHTTEPFSTMTSAVTWTRSERFLVSTVGPFLKLLLQSGSLGQIPPSL